MIFFVINFSESTQVKITRHYDVNVPHYETFILLLGDYNRPVNITSPESFSLTSRY